MLVGEQQWINKRENNHFSHFIAQKHPICANIRRLWAFPWICVFQDFCERRSVWKHISHSNDTEALAVDAFKKQCYMKVNRAIKWFLKRRRVTREVIRFDPRSCASWRERRLALLLQIMVFMYFFRGKHEKTKLAELERRASRDGIHEAVHCPDINHVKTRRWPREDV